MKSKIIKPKKQRKPKLRIVELTKWEREYIADRIVNSEKSIYCSTDGSINCELEYKLDKLAVLSKKL